MAAVTGVSRRRSPSRPAGVAAREGCRPARGNAAPAEPARVDALPRRAPGARCADPGDPRRVVAVLTVRTRRRSPSGWQVQPTTPWPAGVQPTTARGAGRGQSRPDRVIVAGLWRP